jgi:flagellar hook assembly protein FlgD
MKNAIKTSIFAAVLSLSLVSCQKEFYMPTAPVNVADTTSTVSSNEETIPTAVLGEDVAKLNFVWVQPEGANANLQGVKIEIADKNGEVVFSAIDVMAAGDEMFQWYPGIILEADEYTFTMKSASGNVLSVSTLNVADAFQQDEYIHQADGAKFFLQMTWEKASEI